MAHASAKLRARFTILNRTMQLSRHNGNRTQIDAVSPFIRQMKSYRFENAPLLAAFSNLPGFGNGLNRCSVKRS